MKRLFSMFTTVLIVCCLTLPAFAAGTWELVSSGSNSGAQLRWMHYRCTADAADGSCPDYTVSGFVGYSLYSVETWPGATAPTDGTDMTLSDATTSEDLLGGKGTNAIDATSSLTIFPYSPTMEVFYNPPVKGNLTIGVSNNSVNSAIINVRITGGK